MGEFIRINKCKFQNYKHLLDIASSKSYRETYSTRYVTVNKTFSFYLKCLSNLTHFLLRGLRGDTKVNQFRRVDTCSLNRLCKADLRSVVSKFESLFFNSKMKHCGDKRADLTCKTTIDRLNRSI